MNSYTFSDEAVRDLNEICEYIAGNSSRAASGSISPLQPSARNWSFEAGGRRQEAGGRRKKERGRRKKPEEGRSQKKYFYKYEMLPSQRAF
ncbi:MULTISPECIES: hypothetical protein [unclassified Microcoleus]|uniref:hypothetical protein n=1 Tax=unclassified Microcoleus TaxID=2642155 RepID=UPI002FCF9C1F